jgi:hypothetical protein
MGIDKHEIEIQGSDFIDHQRRSLHLRGVNIGGSSKVPRVPDGATWNKAGFFDHHRVSFVGRPFPIEDADEHFARLKKWGLRLLRFIITWEAIEHEGPGIYDQAYLDYLYQVVKKAGEYELYLFIDPHQDVWSRFSGGDGAPGWTFEVVGMDLTRFKETGAAIRHQEIGDPYPRMIWPANYSKFACATMWTLFFGGNVFAPETRLQGIPVQDYLQNHYFRAIAQVCERLEEFKHVIGYDTLNEPSQGYIGYPEVNLIPAEVLAQGASPTIFQGMLLAAGYPQRVKVRNIWSNLLDFGKTALIDPQGKSLWRPGVKPIWQHNGIWDVDREGKPVLLEPNHFALVAGREVDFDLDFFVPFVNKYIQVIREVDPSKCIFVSPPPADVRYGPENYGIRGQKGLVNSPHWYDGITVQTQSYFPWFGIDNQGDRRKFIFGRKRKRRSFQKQIKRLVENGQTMFGVVPTVIGETGIPFNMGKKTAYRDGDFSQHILAMDDTLQALEANCVNFTLWNYTADNSNARGDQWNDEDFSIFSRDQQTSTGEIHDGGRALQAVLRPYVYRTPGKLLSMSFNMDTKVFECTFEWNPQIQAPLEIFIPDFQYPHGFEVAGNDGDWDFNPDSQILIYAPLPGERTQQIRITPKENLHL